MDYSKLCKEYLNKKDGLIFNKEDVENILIENFKAVEFSYKSILDLKRHNHFVFEKIYKAFTIQNSDVLGELFSSEEKEGHEEARNYVIEGKFTLSKSERVYNQMIIDEQLGKRIDIILESKDGKFVSEFEVRSQCKKMDRYLNSITVDAKLSESNIEFEEDINDEDFQFYLENLHMFGFLNN